MRANVTYSVDTDNIPEEISRLVRNESEDLIQKLHEARVSLSDGNLIDARNKIMSARQALGNADIRLYELDQILAGYIEIVNQTPEEEAKEGEAPEEQSEEPRPNEDG